MIDSTLIHLVSEAAPTQYAPPELWRYLTKFSYFVGLVLVIGSTIVHRWVLRPAIRQPGTASADAAALRRRSTTVLIIAGAIFFLSLYPQLAGKAARAGESIPYSQALAPSKVWGYLSESAPAGIPLGTMVLIQFVLYAVGSLLLIGLVLPQLRRHVDAIAGVVAVTTMVASVLLAIGGDLGSRDVDGWMSRLPTYLHVLSVTTWIGGVATLATIATVRKQLSPGSGLIWAVIWKRFSRFAQLSVAGIALSGFWLVWGVVGSPAQLFTTGFGRVLLLKITLVCVLIGIGLYNEYVLLPRIVKYRTAGDEGGVFSVAVRHFPRTAAVEATLGLCVLLVLPFLNGSARAEVGEEEPLVNVGMFIGTAVLIVILAAALVINARVQTLAEQRAAQAARAEQDPTPTPSLQH